MQYDAIFQAYYSQYRAEATIPSSTDDEYIIGMRLANEAVSRWANYDSTYWKELFTTAQTNGTGAVLIVSAGVNQYAAPTAMQEPGGYLKMLDSNNVVQRRMQIVDPQEAQFLNSDAHFAYFTGNASQGFVLNLNHTPTTGGWKLDYVYYKKPTQFTTGTSTTEMANPYFIVHRMLANRFRASRNPYYTSALRDAESALSIMKMDNDSGNWANPWSVPDRSGTVWGGGDSSGWSFN
jgi:hypothetical protein